MMTSEHAKLENPIPRRKFETSYQTVKGTQRRARWVAKMRLLLAFLEAIRP